MPTGQHILRGDGICDLPLLVDVQRMTKGKFLRLIVLLFLTPNEVERAEANILWVAWCVKATLVWSTEFDGTREITCRTFSSSMRIYIARHK